MFYWWAESNQNHTPSYAQNSRFSSAAGNVDHQKDNDHTSLPGYRLKNEKSSELHFSSSMPLPARPAKRCITSCTFLYFVILSLNNAWKGPSWMCTLPRHSKWSKSSLSPLLRWRLDSLEPVQILARLVLSKECRHQEPMQTHYFDGQKFSELFSCRPLPSSQYQSVFSTCL